MEGTEVSIKQNLPQLTEAVPEVEISLQQWIYKRVKPFISGSVLEVSDGAGQIAPYCSQNNTPTKVVSVNLSASLFSMLYEDLYSSSDMLIVLNAMEQVVNHRAVINNCAQLLKNEGHIVIQLPACTALYNGLDQGFRRWKSNNMEFMYNILRAHFRMVKTRYFIVADELPQFSERLNKYRERVAIFHKKNAQGFTGVGLSAIVVGKKR